MISESMLLPWIHIWVHSLILDRVCVYVQGQGHLGSMEELNLGICMLESCPHAVNAGELAPATALGRCDYTPHLGQADSWQSWWHKHCRVAQLSSHPDPDPGL